MRLNHGNYLTILYSTTILHLAEMIINLHTNSLHDVFTGIEILLSPLMVIGIVGALVTNGKKKGSVN